MFGHCAVLSVVLAFGLGCSSEVVDPVRPAQGSTDTTEPPGIDPGLPPPGGVMRVFEVGRATRPDTLGPPERFAHRLGVRARCDAPATCIEPFDRPTPIPLLATEPAP
jgi:hypothetical protein